MAEGGRFHNTTVGDLSLQLLVFAGDMRPATPQAKWVAFVTAGFATVQLVQHATRVLLTSVERLDGTVPTEEERALADTVADKANALLNP